MKFYKLLRRAWRPTLDECENNLLVSNSAHVYAILHSEDCTLNTFLQNVDWKMGFSD